MGWSNYQTYPKDLSQPRLFFQVRRMFLFRLRYALSMKCLGSDVNNLHNTQALFTLLSTSELAGLSIAKTWEFR